MRDPESAPVDLSEISLADLRSSDDAALHRSVDKEVCRIQHIDEPKEQPMRLQEGAMKSL
jgi:hypothetical protein